MDKPSPIAQEYADRLERERVKAREKYGEAALAPAGHPDLDILDYLINELVGLNRYSQMLEARCKMMEQLIRKREIRELCREGVAVARQVLASGGRQALDLIAIRQGLKAHGLQLGQTERRAATRKSYETEIDERQQKGAKP